MLPENIKVDFEKVVLLFIADEMDHTDKKFWLDKIEQFPELNDIIEEYSTLCNLTESIPEITVDEKLVETVFREINEKSRTSFFHGFGEFISQISFTPALRFAVVIMFFAAGLLIVKYSSNENEHLANDVLLDWEGNSISRQMDDLDEKLKLINAIGEGKTSEKGWDEKINNINKRIQNTSEEHLIDIDQSFIRNLSE